jgi:hypothetical protein
LLLLATRNLSRFIFKKSVANFHRTRRKAFIKSQSKNSRICVGVYSPQSGFIMDFSWSINKLQLFNEPKNSFVSSRHLLSSQALSDYTGVVGYFDEDYKNDEKFTVSSFVMFRCEIILIYKAAFRWAVRWQFLFKYFHCLPPTQIMHSLYRNCLFSIIYKQQLICFIWVWSFKVWNFVVDL